MAYDLMKRRTSGPSFLSLPITHDLPKIKIKMLHYHHHRYPFRHSTYFTKTDHIWTSELPVSVTFIMMIAGTITKKKTVQYFFPPSRKTAYE